VSEEVRIQEREENIIDEIKFFREWKQRDQGIPRIDILNILCSKDVLKCEIWEVQEQRGEINFTLGAAHTFILKDKNDENND
jgi:hypothetical protein